MGSSKLSGKPDEMLGLASHAGGVAIFLVASCYGNRDKLRRCWPLGSCADLYREEQIIIEIKSNSILWWFITYNSEYCLAWVS